MTTGIAAGTDEGFEAQRGIPDLEHRSSGFQTDWGVNAFGRQVGGLRGFEHLHLEGKRKVFVLGRAPGFDACLGGLERRPQGTYVRVEL